MELQYSPLRGHVADTKTYVADVSYGVTVKKSNENSKNQASIRTGPTEVCVIQEIKNFREVNF